MQGSKLYVGNLSYSITEEQLQELFSKYGAVASVNIITDRDTGRGKGFGFIEMSSPEEAEKAQEALDGSEFEGRSLKVNEAKPQKPRQSGDYQNRGHRRY